MASGVRVDASSSLHQLDSNALGGRPSATNENDEEVFASAAGCRGRLILY